MVFKKPSLEPPIPYCRVGLSRYSSPRHKGEGLSTYIPDDYKKKLFLFNCIFTQRDVFKCYLNNYFLFFKPFGTIPVRRNATSETCYSKYEESFCSFPLDTMFWSGNRCALRLEAWVAEFVSSSGQEMLYSL